MKKMQRLQIAPTMSAIALAAAAAFPYGSAQAVILGANATSGQNVRFTGAETYNGSGAGINVYYQDNLNDGVQAHSDNVVVTLGVGATLTGASPTASSFLSIFTSDQRDSGDSDNTGDYDSFSFAGSNKSTLNIQGNNTITGAVGYHLSFVGGNPVGYTYGGLYADAIDEVNIYGDVTFNSMVQATQIKIHDGSAGIDFYNRVDANVGSSDGKTTLAFNGNNATVTLHDGVALDGKITNTSTNGVLAFTGTGTVTGNVGDGQTAIGVIELNGASGSVNFNGNLSADELQFKAAGTVSIAGNLYLSADSSSGAVNAVNFDSYDGVLQVGRDIVGISNKQVVSTTVNDRGTVTLLGGDLQTPTVITGNIGATGLALKRLNVGGTGTGGGIDTSKDSAIATIVNGDIFANEILLSNNDVLTSWSGLTLGSNFDITGAVKTETNGMGTLILAGGTQTVTGTVGESGKALRWLQSGASSSSSTFTGEVFAQTVANVNAGTGNTTFNAAVVATDVNVAAGTSTFQSDLNATTTNIGTGKGVFNGTTTTNIAFTEIDSEANVPGTADLNQGLTGSITFDATNDATVNLADGKTISGTITASDVGTLNALGGGTLKSTVTTLSTVNVNRGSATANGDTEGLSTKTLTLADDLAATAVRLFNAGELKLNNGVNLNTALTTTTDKTGVLTLVGSSVVTGAVGTSGTALDQVNAGATGATDSFNNGVVYANNLLYSGTGNVILNGKGAADVDHTGGLFNAGTNDLGMVGTANFADQAATFTLGDNVDLITAHDADAADHTQTAFTNANGATLRFAGSSVVTGDLGSAANTGNENFKDIYAGQAIGDTVSLRGDVYVASTTFHVGAGVVNLLGNLNGPMVFDADGSANVADGKGMTGIVTTATNGTGTLNFVGSATTQAPIGTAPVGQTAAVMLKAVNFHADTTDSTVLPVTGTAAAINIGHDVYAMTTTVGNGTSATVASLNASVYLGNAVVLAGGNVTLNTAAGVVTAADISPLDFDYTRLENGHLQNTATVTQSAFGSSFSSNGATMNFAVAATGTGDDAQTWDDTQGGGLIDANASSRLTGASGSSLNMTGNETINLSLLGSLRNGQAYTLIDVTGGAGTGDTSIPATLHDNSFVITTTLSRANGASGDLVVTATRADEVYITRSDTHGDISNPAALRLGQLAAAGTGYSQDMQTVLNKIDIDQWGFGNTQAKLANQAKSLAPVANGSIANAGLDAQSYALDQIGSRLKDMREVEFAADGKKPKSVWMRNLMDNRRQDSTSAYDGYKTKLTGFQLGGDISPSKRSLIGVAISSGSAEIAQHDFRAGELANVDSTQLSVYGSYDFTDRLYADAMASTARLSIAGVRGTAVGRQASYNHDAKGTAFKLNLGYKIPVINEATSLTPVLSFQRTSLTEDAYLETGAGDVGLSVAERKQTRQETGLGLRLATTTMLKGYVVKPELAIMRTRDNKALDAQAVTASYLGDLSATTFDTSLATAAKPYANKVQLGMSMLLNKSSALSLRYEHTNGSGYKSNKGELAVRWNW